MSGAFCGVQARIKDLQPQALYVRGTAHCLNLLLQLVKLINRAATVRHHSTKWKDLPESLSTQLDDFVSGITPPAPSFDLENKIRELTDTYKQGVAKTVRDHLQMVLYETGEKLTKLSELDLDRAKAVATKQIRGHFKKDKVPNEDLNHWVKMAADLAGTHPSLSKKDEPREKKSKMKVEESKPKPLKTMNQLDKTKTEHKILAAKNKKIKKIKYAALIQKLKKLRIQKETKKEKEPVVVPETQQETGNKAKNEEDDEEIPSFQQLRDEETIEWDNNFPILQLSQDDGQNPITAGSSCNVLND